MFQFLPHIHKVAWTMKHCRRLWAMKELETFVKTVGEGLRTLAQGVHAIADKLESYVDMPGDAPSEPEFEPAVDHNIHAKTAPVTPADAPSREKPAITATALVYEKISSAEGSVSMDDLYQETGFDRKKLSNILHRLRLQGKIKNVGKGVYVKK